MGFFKKLLRKKGIVTLIAFIACLVIIVYGYSKRVDEKLDTIEIPYALVQIDSRTLITDDMIGTVKVPRTFVNASENIITDKTYLTGEKKYVNYNTYIAKGSFFYLDNVVTWDNMPDSIWENVEVGYKVYALKVNNTTTFGNSIYPTDKIDIYFKINSSGIIFGKLISGVEVKAVKDGNGNHIFKRDSSQESASSLLFYVDDEMFSLLNYAEIIGGELIPVPRNSNYNPGSTLVSDTVIKNFILNNKNILILKSDVIDTKNTDNSKLPDTETNTTTEETTTKETNTTTETETTKTQTETNTES